VTARATRSETDISGRTIVHLRFLSCVAACALGAGPAAAQTCASPSAIASNMPTVFDTCQGESSLVLACGVIPLAGPATVVGLNLPYPEGDISIQSMDANYAPTAFLLRARCANDAPCSAVAWSPAGIAGSIDLSSLDSGSYFLVIAADANASGASCGPVLVTANVTTEQQALFKEGIFHSGSAPIWEP
jgi:hypothetical protein